MSHYPTSRPRRLRSHPALRSLTRETRLHPSQFILPLFVQDTDVEKEPINSMVGHFRFNLSAIVGAAKEAYDAGIGGILLFGISSIKDDKGSNASSAKSVVPQAIKLIREAVPGLLIMTDVCVCAYTDHGHCGVVKGDKIDNDASLQSLAAMALAHAQAGAHTVAPSAMMDGQVSAIRETLDANGFEEVSIMAYAAKFQSSWYGPFREAAGSAPGFGDRSTYQMDPANRLEALREAGLDEAEGADILMVKPALLYLDIIREVRDSTLLPVAAYNVSGEFAAVTAAGQNGWLDREAAMMEVLLSIARAGANIIISYHALEAANFLRKHS